MSSYLGFQPTNATPYYFVSYSTEDAAKVGPIVQILSQKLPLWYDYGLTYGEDWGKDIADHIENSEAVLLFLSKQIFAKGLNSYVYTEYQMAKDYFQKPLIIIQIEGINRSDITNDLLGWWIELNRYQNIIRQPDTTDESFAELIYKALRKDEKTRDNAQNNIPIHEEPPKKQIEYDSSEGNTPPSQKQPIKEAYTKPNVPETPQNIAPSQVEQDAASENPIDKDRAWVYFLGAFVFLILPFIFKGEYDKYYIIFSIYGTIMGIVCLVKKKKNKSE